MKIAGQFAIILAISFVGEWLNDVLVFPVPASIYGFVILFVLLLLKVIHLEQIKDVADFFQEIMPILFVPAGVGLMPSWGLVKGILWQIVTIILVSTIAVMAVSGRVTQWVIRLKRKSLSETDGKCKRGEVRKRQ